MTPAVLLLPLLAPACAATFAAVPVRGDADRAARPGPDVAAVAASAVVLAAGAAVAVATRDGDVLALGHVLRADALTAVMLLVIGAVATVATWAGVGHVRRELATGRTTPRGARRYRILVPLFVATMAGAVLAANLGVMWAAIEATTIVTALLVGHHGGRRAVEATWKYVIVCSVGIALAYLGTVLVYYASQHAGGPAAAGAVPEGTLDWAELVARGGALDPGVMRIAIVLLLLGFGTKAGLVPMHGWLPDAHSQAPAPVSALMSGVLLSVAVYALLRYRVVAVASLDPAFLRGLVLTVALASVALAASLLLGQRDYKRMLAYSSIEHMGLAVLGVAVGTRAAVAAVLLHVLGHGLAKSVLFCGAGRVLEVTGTTRIADVRGLLVREPALGGALALAFAALLGLPPFSLFASELALARATADAGLGWVVAVALALLLVAFVAIARPVAGMLLGPAPEDEVPDGEVPDGAVPAEPVQAGPRWSVAPLVAGLAALAVLGVLAPLDGLLTTAAAIVGTR